MPREILKLLGESEASDIPIPSGESLEIVERYRPSREIKTLVSGEKPLSWRQERFDIGPIPELRQEVAMPKPKDPFWEIMSTGTAAALSTLPLMKNPKNPWLWLVSMGVYSATQGAFERKPPLETTKEIVTEDIPMAMVLGSLGPGAKTLGEFAKRLGQVGAITTKGAMGETLLSPSYYQKYFAEPILKGLGKIANIPIVPKALEEKGLISGRTLKTLFQPAIERVPKTAAASIRKAGVSETTMRQLSQGIAGGFNILNPEERFHVTTFLSRGQWEPKGALSEEYMKLSLDSKARINQLLGTIGEWFSLTKERKDVYETMREMSFREHLGKLFSKSLHEGHSLDPIYLKELKPFFTGEPFKAKKFLGLTYMSEVQVGLKKIIEHPSVTPEAQELAKDLYNLTASSLEILPKVAREAEKAVLFPKLRNNPMVTSTKPKPGFVTLDHKEFKGLYVEKETAQAIEELGHIDTISTTIWNKFFMAPWKMGKVVLRIPTHFRNVYGNMVLNDWGGMSILNPRTYRTYIDAIKELKKQGPLTREFQKMTGVATTFADVETAHFPTALKYGANPFDIAEYLFSRITKPFARLYQMEETWAKTAKYIWNLDNGMSKKDAALDAVKWTFNYGEVTPFVRTVRQTFVPFATWQTKVIPLMIETAIKHPVRFLKWMAVPLTLTALGLSQVGMSPDEWQELKRKFPDYLKEGVFSVVPWRDKNEKLQLFNWTWMLPGIGDVADLKHQGLFTFFQHPLLTWAGNLQANKTFSGAPIWYDWEPSEVKAWRMLTHTYMQFAPSIIGTDVRDLYRTAQEHLFEPMGLTEVGEKKALTPLQLLASQFGLRVSPILESEVAQKYYQRLKAMQREIRSNMSKELKNAKTDRARQTVIQKYTGYLKETITPEE